MWEAGQVIEVDLQSRCDFMKSERGFCRRPVFEVLEPRVLLAADNLSIVPFFDGETTDPLINRLGGPTFNGTNATISYDTQNVFSGRGGYRIDTSDSIPGNGFGLVGMALTGFGPDPRYVDARDITGFDEIRFFAKEAMDESFRLVFEIKDYRDSLEHRARREVSISDAWEEVAIPLDLTQGWEVIGSPDLTRARIFAFVMECKVKRLAGPFIWTK